MTTAANNLAKIETIILTTTSTAELISNCLLKFGVLGMPNFDMPN
jgi:hypothetical protein